MFGKENKKRELISRLPEIYIQLQREYHISAGDFPKVKAMQVRRPVGGALPPGPAGFWVHISVSWFRMEENAVFLSS